MKQVYVGSTPVREVYVGAKKVWPTSEVHEVSLTRVAGTNVAHALTTLTIPEGQTWQVRIQGQIIGASESSNSQPFFRIGAVDGARLGSGSVDVSGTVTSTAPSIALVTTTARSLARVSFTGTVTIEK